MKNITTTKLLCMIFLSVGSFVHAQIVTSSADDGSAGTLRNQIAIANDGDIITFAVGVDNIVLSNGPIVINNSITLTGNLVTNTIIDGNDNGRIFNITSGDVIMNDLEITNGTAVDGGAVLITNASLLINSSTISNSVAAGDGVTPGSGGGIFVGTGGSLTAVGCSIINNQANRAGGGIESVAGTDITLNNVNLDNNNAGGAPATPNPGNGGGLHITGDGNATIIGGTVNNNAAALEGGGLWNGAGFMDIDGTTIDNNTASGAAADNGGGGVFNLSGTVSIINATITNNDADGGSGSGGGIFNDVGATLEIENSSVIGNTSNRAGGGIEVNSGAGAIVNLFNVTLNGNIALASPGNGGGLHVTGDGTVNIDGGTVNTNIAGAEGGGLWNGSGTMTISGTTIDGNTASGVEADQGGGGIYNLNGGTLTIEGATITNNIANGALGSGGGILNDVGSQLSISDTSIVGNTAVRAGGGIEDNSGSSTIILNNVTLNTNSVTGPPGNGGGLHITGGGSATITDGTINGNTAALEGGGLWNGTGTMTISGTTINANIASGGAADDGGGGIFNNGGTLNVNDSTISNNLANGTSGSGGGIFSTAGAVTIGLTFFEANSANRAGGAIEIIDGTLTMSDGEIFNNDVDGTAGTPNPGNGGALHVTGVSTVGITNCVFSENDASREGGALWNQTGSNMTVVGSTIDSNTASGPDATHGGGGIFNNGGTLVVQSSTLSYNVSDGALGNGGGIHVKSGTAEVLTSTISGNTSVNAGGGLYSNASLSITSATIAENSATGTGGGIATESTSTTSTFVKSSIVAMNSGATGFDVSAGGTYNSGGYNLIGEDDLAAFTAGTNDIIGAAGTPVDPLIGPLADNGGPTQTHALLANSPAYNAGEPADSTIDQIGNPVFGGIRDIGAYEAQTVLGINEVVFNNSNRSIIYPNPANSFVKIQLSTSFGSDVNARIIEIASGKTVKELKLNGDASEVSVSGLSAGIYAVQISSDITTETHKLIIQ